MCRQSRTKISCANLHNYTNQFSREFSEIRIIHVNKFWLQILVSWQQTGDEVIRGEFFMAKPFTWLLKRTSAITVTVTDNKIERNLCISQFYSVLVPLVPFCPIASDDFKRWLIPFSCARLANYGHVTHSVAAGTQKAFIKMLILSNVVERFELNSAILRD